MGDLFSKPKVVQAPALPPVEPIPTTEGTGVEDAERRRLRRGSGRRETFITGDLTPETDKKRKLGR